MNISDLIITEPNVIPTSSGSIMHLLKNTDAVFRGFGECYLSSIGMNDVRAWKLHNLMTCNLLVIKGLVKFVFVDNRMINTSQTVTDEIIIGPDNYKRITVPPGITFGFQGICDDNLIINIANICHNESEVSRFNIDSIKYNWN